MKEAEAFVYGLEAYVYGFPLVMMDVTKEVLTAAPAPNAQGTAAPINQFAKMPGYVSPDFKNVVRIGLNGLWATAWLDLDQEPIVLSVPDTKGRYYLMSLMSMWTNVFGSPGKRTTGTGAGSFLIAGPKWHGTAPADIKQTFQCPTRFAWVLGQTQVNGPKDFAAVIALQNQYKLTPLSAWGKPYTPPANVPVELGADTKATPFDQMQKMDAGTFFKRLAMLMKDNPPAAEDAAMAEKLKKLGIEPGKDFDITKVDPGIASGLNRAVEEAWSKLQSGAKEMKTKNGWAVLPEDIGDYGTDYDTRAGVAIIGLGADIPEDTVYPSAYLDADGKPLEGAQKYVLHFDKGQTPPTNATWSVSLYQGNFYVPNPMNRYALIPWMPLKYNKDGSLDMYIQAESPGKAKEANWLPSPASGEINITIRNYWPKEAAINGSYKIPPIKRLQ